MENVTYLQAYNRNLKTIGDSLLIDLDEVAAIQFVPGGDPFDAKQGVEAAVYLRDGQTLNVSEADGRALMSYLSKSPSEPSAAAS